VEDGNLVNEKVVALGARVQEEGQAKTGGPESSVNFCLVLVHVVFQNVWSSGIHYHFGVFNYTARQSMSTMNICQVVAKPSETVRYIMASCQQY